MSEFEGIMEREAFARLRKLASEKLSLVALVQLLFSGLAVAMFSWSLVSFLKGMIWRGLTLDTRPWALSFFNPQQAALTNYLALCLAIAGYAFVLYRKGGTGVSPDSFAGERLGGLTRLTLLSMGLLICSPFLPPGWRLLTLAIAAATPAMCPLHAPKLSRIGTLVALAYRPVSVASASPALTTCSLNTTKRNSLTKLLVSAAPWTLLAAVSLEPLLVAKGPVYLMNEYQELYGRTIIDGVCVSNKEFLDGITQADIAVFFSAARERTSSEDPRINRIKQFRSSNDLEYSHQNMGRGPFNHIGHILNPLNEYELNAPIGRLYFQYGLGNSFVMKWMMDLFGGISVQNYYKCYLLYIAYGACFLGMLYYIFQGQSTRVLGAFAIYVSAYFFTGYIGYIFAPGVIPSIHFFDVAAIAFFAGVVKGRKNWFCVTGLVIACLLGVLTNPRFGWILTVACVIGLVLYVIENAARNEKARWLVGAGCLLLGAVAIGILLPDGSAHGTVRYFFMGYFSWSPRSAIVYFTATYLVASCALLIAMRNTRRSSKYVYSMVFFYAQGVLTYYYWSGLDNHLPMAVPYLGLQGFLTFSTLTEIFERNDRARRRLHAIEKFAVVLALSLTVFGGYKFYSQKTAFFQHFATHRTFTWTLPRAKIVTTIDPVPIQEAVALIDKYSGQQRHGIYLVSKYDSFLPFLSARYSLMPYPELGYSLITERDVRRAVDAITDRRPEYIFVDTDIDTYSSGADPSAVDPWSKLFNNKNSNRERASRLGRMVELRRVYESVASGYVKIDGGRLISVYRKVRGPDRISAGF
jgi:hypothetical protein